MYDYRNWLSFMIFLTVLTQFLGCKNKMCVCLNITTFYLITVQKSNIPRQMPESNKYPDKQEVHVKELVHAEQAVGHAEQKSKANKKKQY